MLEKWNRGATLSGVLFIAAALGFLDTARAQSVTITTSGGQALSGALAFSVAAGSLSTAQTLNVTTPPNNGNTLVITVPAQYSQWLVVTPNSAVNTPGQIQVSVNAASLSVGTVSGNFSIALENNAQSAQTVSVNATITGTSALSASPSSLSFTAVAGQSFGTPQNCAQQNFANTCQVAISSTAGTIAYNVTASPTTWLVPDQFSGSTSGAPMNIGVNASTLSQGIYTGQIEVQSTTTPSDSVTIAVTLTVTSSATLSATPTGLNFYYTTGGAVPGAQPITVSSTGGAIAFDVNQSAGSQSWLKVSILSGVASNGNPATVTVSVTPTAAMTPGPYTATLNLTSPNSSATVNVTLTVSQNPFLTVNTNQLAFSAQFAGTPPATQGITVGSTGGTLNFTATASSTPAWLAVSPSGGVTGPNAGALTVGVSQTGLNALSVGTYQGTITIAPTNGDQYSLVVQVTLTVGVSSTLVAAPSQLVFSYQIGQAQPAAQTVALLSTGPSAAFTIQIPQTGGANCGTGTWLTATALQSPQATPNTLSVGVNTTGMTAGTCNGIVKILYTGLTGPAETDVQVTLFVSTSPLLTISQPNGFGYDVAPLGTNTPIQHTIAIGSTDGSAVQYTVAPPQSAPCPWLTAAPATGSNPGTSPTQIQVQILPGCITTPAPYLGAIQITSPGLPTPVTLSLNLVVTSTVQVSVAPQTLTFNEAQGGAQPPSQTLNFTVSGGNAAFVATPSSNFNWLTVSPSSGNTSLGKISVSVNNNTLPANTYNGSINITFVNAETASATIPVQLVVGPAETLTASPTSLSFSYQLSGAVPAAQTLTLASTGGSANFNVAATSTGSWLSVTPASGSTGSSGSQTVSVSINPANIPTSAAAGQSLTGSLSITAPGVLANPITIPVTLAITSAPTPSVSTISTSAVNNGYGPIAPGELITIKGTNLGPGCATGGGCVSGGVSFTVGANGAVSSTLAGVGVTFDGIAGTPSYVSPTQINVIVPWEIAGRTSTTMVVSYNGVPSTGLSEQVVAVAPGIFTQNATGSGQVAAVNLSSSAASVYNGPAGQNYPGTTTAMAPAPAGTDVALFLTGGGVTSPASVTGSVNPSAAVPLQNWTPGSSTVTATIGNQPAMVLYAGAAPTLVTGVVQINLQIPAGVTGSALPVVITIDGVTTQTTATIAVQ